MEDNLLIERVLSISVLKDAILEMTSKTGALNLVEPGWEEILNNNALFKKYRDGAIRYSKGASSKNDKVHVKNVIGMSNCLKVIVVGYWCLNVPGELTESKIKDTSIVCRKCNALVCIADAMKENPSEKLHDNFRFFIENCDAKYCISCKRAMDKCHLSFNNNWCITKTKVYNGENIKHAFKPTMESIFGFGNCIGILNLTISNRYSFGDQSFKIGGICHEMILFKESALNPCVELDIEYPIISSNVPSITYPDESFIGCIPNNDEKSDTEDGPSCKKMKY
ncbi:uncharacterized protein TNIN_179601 [Trichonephila inaurata madagascariensis]|uniref:Uncharacterized protein n=1 Tax=Trichonephila inaurata madagascariensis TaxID=2747483 RepID=A0A8X6Y997_9ARAC|nr:uncharacterized protein TNIN_179601 [Trichonephila inaurata madagascariensis]